MPPASRTKWLERLLLAAGILCLGYYSYAAASAASFQHQQRRRLEQLVAPGTSHSAPGTEHPAPHSAPGTRDRTQDSGRSTEHEGLLGLLDIPRLGISTPVISGDDEKALDLAVGHLPDTPRPWEAGNSAIAAHRDGLFRPLKNIRVGDRITMRTPHGDFDYQVQATRIVRPTDLSVLTPREADALTLITCYPFNFIGSAPQRFVVHALRTGGATAAAGVLPSRSLASLARYSAATARVPEKTITQRPATAAGRRHAQLARARVSRGQRVSASAAYAERQRVDRAAPQRDRRQRDTASGDRRNGPDASRSNARKDDRAPKKRRWFDIFRR